MQVRVQGLCGFWGGKSGDLILPSLLSKLRLTDGKSDFFNAPNGQRIISFDNCIKKSNVLDGSGWFVFKDFVASGVGSQVI